MISRVFRAVLLVLLALISMQDRSGAQDHERPYFMPPTERDRLHDLILKEAWAKADYARLKKSPQQAMALLLHSFMHWRATPGTPPLLNSGC